MGIFLYKIDFFVLLFIHTFIVNKCVLFRIAKRNRYTM